MGANVLRIPFNYRHFERDDRPFEYLDAGFQRLDAAMDWCARHDIYVILDFHAVQGWHNPDWHSDNAHVHILLYQHKHFQDRFVGLWQAMAARYKDHPALAGYDLMNEPCTRVQYDDYDAPSYDWDALNAVHRRAAQAIRAVDAQHIIFVEGDNFACAYDGLDVTFDDNLVVSTHNYMAPTGGGEPYPGVIDGMYWNRDIVAAELGMHSGTRLAFKQRKPIFVGEFGVWYAGHRDSDRLSRRGAWQTSWPCSTRQASTGRSGPGKTSPRWAPTTSTLKRNWSRSSRRFYRPSATPPTGKVKCRPARWQRR